uniref:Uncharacterized protein n=1 Tax=Plectus sambesii TaxID=2011161 RepID=A0A914VRJ9_9BILA
MSLSQSPQQASSSSAQEIAQEDSRKDKEDSNNTFHSHNHGGKNLSGQVRGEHVTIVQGHYYASGQASSTSPAAPTPEELKKMLET